MTRTLVFPLTILVALATGLTLLGIAITLTHDPITLIPSVVPAEDEGAVEVVHRFYAAANEVLQTGDATALHGAVASDYRESTSLMAPRTGVAGYVQFLTELRSACPDCRLETEELAMGNDGATVRVSTHGRRHGTVRGVSLEGLPIDWSALDVLRLVEGKVVERWSQGDSLSVATPLFSDVAVAVPAGTVIVQVSRLILPAGASLPSVAVPGPTLLVVEAGDLAVHTLSTGRLALDPTTMTIDAVLGDGDQLVISPGVLPMVRNDGPSPVVVLVLVLRPGAQQPIDIDVSSLVTA